MIAELLTPLFVVMIALHISWLTIYFLPTKKTVREYTHPPVSIILPAHNEAAVIAETVRRSLEASYPGVKEVIVVNDGSTDGTGDVVRGIASADHRVKLIDVPHGGKSNAINIGFSRAKGDVIVVVDADSELAGDALTELVKPFSDERVGAVSGVIRVSMNNNPLTWFQDVEYMMSSTWRHLCNKLNATYLLPGFTAFRRKTLEEVGGFRRDTLSEDFEIGLRIKKAGYSMAMADAVMYTHVPQDIGSLIRQRVRWSRGTLQVVKKHSDVPFNKEYGAVGLYGIPTQLYWFVHGFIAIPITFYQVTHGYVIYFVKYNDFLSTSVFKYFFGWFSLYGMLDYSYQTFIGNYPMDALFILCFISFLLGNVYTILSIFRYSRISWKHAVALFFYYPYSLFCLVIFTVPMFYEISPFAGKGAAVNIWSK